MKKPVEPILVADLFPEIRMALLDLLTSLSIEEWHLPTVCEGWTVKDIAAHLLADDMGILSGLRDGYFVKADIKDWESLITFINRQNDVWVQATRRLSPLLLCDLLNFTAPQVEACFEAVDPFQIGGPVDWAGPDPAPVWMDIAREFTERWMHQQHIRDAVNRPGLKEHRYFYPVLAAFVRAMPHTYRNTDAPENTLVKPVISGDEWHLVRENQRWQLYQETDLTPACTIKMDGETAWRLFTKGISPAEARKNTVFEGDKALGEPILHMVSILA